MNILLFVVVFVLGLCLGSFINMLVYRVARSYRYKLEKKTPRIKDKKRSFCDYCGMQLNWYENIPVFSWLRQKGKTNCCKKKLPILYPIVEIVTGLLFFLVVYQFMTISFGFKILNCFEIAIYFIVVTFLVFSVVFDLKYMILPDFSTIILIICSILLWFLNGKGNFVYLFSSIGSFLFLYFLYLITKKKGLGFGDVKLAAFMGLFLGYPKIIIAYYLAFIIGAVVGLILMVLKKAGRKTPLPFGPFLILGVIIAWFWGEMVINLSVFQILR